MNSPNADQCISNGRVLVLGAAGFLGGFIVAALRAAGWNVLCGVRTPRVADPAQRACDLDRMTAAADWLPQLDHIDAVVNVAGILRETRTQRFDRVHHDAPLALAHACVQRGVRRFVQISALGHAGDGAFIASKHHFDAALMALPLQATVLRPSVVYSTAGSYGGTSLLRALAATPGVMMVPGEGEWRIQPLAAEDLALLVVRALECDAGGIFEVGGPDAISLRRYQQRWRDWLRLPRVPIVHVPETLVSLGVIIGDLLGRGPMGAATWRMLRRGNVPAPDAHARLTRTFGFAPRSIEQVLAARPSQVQDRWHAQLYPLAAALRCGVALLFLVSAWAGFVTPAETIERLTAGSSLADLQPVALARIAAACDLALGALLLAGVRSRTIAAAMIVLVATYTVAFGLLLPGLWLDPLGGLAKNLVVLPALALLWVLSDRR